MKEQQTNIGNNNIKTFIEPLAGITSLTRGTLCSFAFYFILFFNWRSRSLPLSPLSWAEHWRCCWLRCPLESQICSWAQRMCCCCCHRHISWKKILLGYFFLRSWAASASLCFCCFGMRVGELFTQDVKLITGLAVSRIWSVTRFYYSIFFFSLLTFWWFFSLFL